MAAIRRTVEMVAGSAGATATINVVKELPITYNDQDLAAASPPTLVRIVGRGSVLNPDPELAAEDFAFYQEKIPDCLSTSVTRTRRLILRRSRMSIRRVSTSTRPP